MPCSSSPLAWPSRTARNGKHSTSQPMIPGLISGGSIWEVPDLQVPCIPVRPLFTSPPPPPPKRHFWTFMHGSGHWALGKTPQAASGPEAGHHHHPTTKNKHDEQVDQDRIRDGSNRRCHMSAGWCPGSRAHWSPRPKIRGPEAATFGVLGFSPAPAEESTTPHAVCAAPPFATQYSSAASPHPPPPTPSSSTISAGDHSSLHAANDEPYRVSRDSPRQ